MKITDIKLKQTSSEPRNRRPCKEFDLSLKVDGVKIKGDILLIRDDGSIREHRGKWYVTVNLGEFISWGDKKKGYGHGSSDCPKCEKELSRDLFEALQPLLEVGKVKIAPSYIDPKRKISVHHHIPITGPSKEVGSRRAGEECVVIYYEMPALCPIHGKVKCEDTDVAD